MSGNPRVPILELDDESWVALADAIGQFERAWQRDPGIEFDPFLPSADHPLRQRMLVELIKSDQEFRWQRGERRCLEVYLARWEELNGRSELIIELLHAECLTRAVLGEPAGVEEIESRFPTLSDQVDLTRVNEEANAERGSFHPTGFHSPGVDTSAHDLEQTPSAIADKYALKPGQLVGRYQVLEPLGRGGMGTVYRALDTRLKREVALKIPRFDPHSDPDAVARFLREGESAARIEHPNVCTIYDAGEIDGVYYMAMRLIRGRSLASEIESRDISPLEAVHIARKLAAALAAVHKHGIVHRDIKPSNVVMDESGEPLLMDFGLARSHDTNGLTTSSGTLLGTVPYMAPEQIDGRPADFLSDIYSFGVLLYQMLTRELPFTGKVTEMMIKIADGRPKRPSSLCPQIDRDLEAICLKAMAKAPEDRFGSADELAEALQRYIDGLPATTAPRAGRGQIGRRCLGLATAGALLACTVIFFKTGYGTLEIEVPAGAVVTIDNKTIDVQSNKVTIRLSVGEHELNVSKEGVRAETREVRIRWRWDAARESVHFTEVPPGTKPPSLVRWIETEPNARGIAVSDDASTIYVAYWGGAGGPIQLVDASSGTVRKTIKFTEDQLHGDLVVSDGGRYLYTVHYYGRYMTRVDLQANMSRTNLDLSADPKWQHTWAADIGITPDRKKLVVPMGDDNRPIDEDNDQLSIVNIADGEFVLLGEVKLQDEPTSHNLAFSDDSQFAYVITRRRKSRGPTLYEVRLTDPYEVARSLTFVDGDLRGVAASTKLNRVFVSDSANRKIWVVDLATFERISEIDLDGHAPENLAVFPERDLLVALCPATRRLFCVDAKDGEILGHLEGLRDGLADAEFSADGDRLFVVNRGSEAGIAAIDVRSLLTWIVFASNRDGESYQIYRMYANGEQPVRITKNHATERFPKWSPDARKIAFVSDRQGRPKVHVVDYRGTLISSLEDTDPLMAPVAWSPDGSEVVFIGNGGKAIRAANVETQAIQTLLEEAVGQGYSLVTGLCWRENDGAVLFASQNPIWGNDCDLFELDPRTLKVRQITDEWGKKGSTWSPAASPDGRRIVTVRRVQDESHQNTISIINADGSLPILLSENKGIWHEFPRWFPDGGRIVYAAKSEMHYGVYTVSAEGDATTQLTAGNWDDLDPDVCDRRRASGDPR
ncbi:MAG: protein kinase [Rhodopirellula sp.]|nr:protein kinase [Rhodopirellula sp.]